MQKKKLEEKLFEDSDESEQITTRGCYMTILSVMITTCKMKSNKEYLLVCYLLIEQGADPTRIVNRIDLYLKNIDIAKDTRGDKKILTDLHERNIDHKEYLNDRKFARYYWDYTFKLRLLQFPK